MKLLVTGGAGFIGSNFIIYWLKQYPKDSIVNVDKLTYAGNLGNLTSIQNNPNYSFVLADICNLALMMQVMKGIDCVVHFAAESHVDRSILNPDSFIKTNIIGTHNLLKAAMDAKISRFHHVSTDEVFGALKLNSNEKFSETSVYNPRSPYSASKAAADHLVSAYFHTYGLPITITNCSNNFGPYQFPEKLIPLVITNLIEEKKVPVYGDGLYERDWLYVEDHCRAIDMVIHHGILGHTYCVGGTTQEFSNLDVVKKIIKYMGKSEDSIVFVKDRPGHDRRYAINWGKIKTELGWEPKHNFDEYLMQTINWYIQNRSWWEKIKNGEYLKYYQKQYGDKL
jgi:dTDP-glucose 4,6-dehydratase